MIIEYACFFSEPTSGPYLAKACHGVGTPLNFPLTQGTSACGRKRSPLISPKCCFSGSGKSMKGKMWVCNMKVESTLCLPLKEKFYLAPTCGLYASYLCQKNLHVSVFYVGTRNSKENILIFAILGPCTMLACTENVFLVFINPPSSHRSHFLSCVMAVVTFWRGL